MRDPKTFNTVRTIDVMDNTNQLGKLNELEYVDGKIYAHVWMTDAIVVIDPNLGRVLAVIDASGIDQKRKKRW